MKAFILLFMVATTLAGCVVAEPDYRDDRGRYDRDNRPRDRDGDGVPNRQDRRPDDPRRY
jgi:hypothetical protein